MYTDIYTLQMVKLNEANHRVSCGVTGLPFPSVTWRAKGQNIRNNPDISSVASKYEVDGTDLLIRSVNSWRNNISFNPRKNYKTKMGNFRFWESIFYLSRVAICCSIFLAAYSLLTIDNVRWFSEIWDVTTREATCVKLFRMLSVRRESSNILTSRTLSSISR